MEAVEMDLIGLESFVAHFDTEDTCADYLFQIKWPNGFVCPRCERRHFYKTTTRRLPLYECATCHHQASLTVGTIMEGSRTSLLKWFIAFFLVSQPHSINALQLKKRIQVTYKTAWSMLHKIRHALCEEDASVLLSGIIQVQDARSGKKLHSVYHRQPKEHLFLVGAVMNEEKEPSYIKMKLLPEKYIKEWTVARTGKEAFVRDHVESEAVEHVSFVMGIYKSRKPLQPFFNQAKRWIREIFRGLGSRHLQAYFDEFCFRMNRMRKEASIFGSLIQLCTEHERIMYKDLVHR
jgi:transposase-like protein